VLSLSRQAVPTLSSTQAKSVWYGAYVLEEFRSHTSPTLSIILVSSGTEISLSLSVANQLSKNHELTVRVVSMPCWELFDEQTLEYQLSVLPDGVPIMSIEASGTHGWSKYSHVAYGMTTFGMSAPLKDIYAYFGFTETNLVMKSVQVVDFYKNKTSSLLSPINHAKFASIKAH
jgi:transketolase